MTTGTIANPLSVGKSSKKKGGFAGPPAGLVVRWLLNEGTGLVAYDTSNNANYTMYMSNQAPIGVGWSADTPGVIAGSGGCFTTLPGVDLCAGKLECYATKFLNYNAARTICLWYRCNGPAGAFEFRSDVIVGGCQVLRYAGSVNQSLEEGTARLLWDSGYGYRSSLSSPEDGNWHHLAVAWNGKKWMHYSDGVYKKGSSVPVFKLSAMQGLTGIYLGATGFAEQNGGLSYVRVKDLRIYSVVLTLAQIKTLAGV